ncbi:outer membrane protein [Sphingomonas morindae]|uniref:Porin family protein n=1 Tax=Sphingomonas morindae TaxID=1541170 RepID=A0ABY4X9Z9_9SPHN|nr:porin family protein [Sphingomonas morindae]USI73669.1 porin family protein [Sphingomonas morindae]
MRKMIMAALATATVFGAQAASAQSTDWTTTSFRGFRLEGNAGGDRFQSQGQHNDKFGYGGTIGFDGQLGDKIVIGPEGSFWRSNKWNENCSGGVNGGSVCQKSFEEWAVAVRAGYLVTPNLLVFGKGGYAVNEQRKRFDAPVGETSYYNHGRTTGYQVGGGVEYTLTQSFVPVPVYVNAQYVYSNYQDHTSRQRVMGGIGVRFK